MKIVFITFLRCVLMIVWTLFAVLSRFFFILHVILEKVLSLFPTRYGYPLRSKQRLPASTAATRVMHTPEKPGELCEQVGEGDKVDSGLVSMEDGPRPKHEVLANHKTIRHPQQLHSAGCAGNQVQTVGENQPKFTAALTGSNPTASVALPYNCDLGSRTQRKWYAVARGRSPGIYKTWEETEKQVTGFSGANHKSFKTYPEASAWIKRQMTAMGATWRAIGSAAHGHRVNVTYEGLDEVGHKVFRCTCCEEIFCTNE